MRSDEINPAACNSLALRQAARHVTQFYDQFLAPSGLRSTQYSILARLQRRGPMTINALAAALVMDRTTLSRNILPLQRDGLIAVGAGKVGPAQQGFEPDCGRDCAVAERAKRLATSAKPLRSGFRRQAREGITRADE